MRLSGLKITASTVERYIVNDGDYCPIPARFSESDCTFLISGVAGSWDEHISVSELERRFNQIRNIGNYYHLVKYVINKGDNYTRDGGTIIGIVGRRLVRAFWLPQYDYDPSNDLHLELERYRINVTVIAAKK